MTQENHVPEEKASLVQRGDLSFWSPWVVFFLGIPFAALNWWRMRKKGKAIFFLILSLLVFLLISWTDFERITPTDEAIATPINLARLFLVIAYSGVLAILMQMEIRQFRESGISSVSVKWPAIFIFWVILLVAGEGIWAALDTGARESGNCRFPRLQDLIYQKELGQRSGLASLVMGRNDFGCGWDWFKEIREPISANRYGLFLMGYLNDTDSSLLVFENVYQYEKVTAEIFSEFVQKSVLLDGSEYLPQVDDRTARYSKIACSNSSGGGYIECKIILGYQKVVTDFNLTFLDMSDEQINELIQSLVSTNSQIVQVYEGK